MDDAMRLIDAYFDELIDDADMAQLEALVASDAAARDAFTQRSLMHRQMLETCKVDDFADARPIVMRARRRYGLAAAALIALTIGVLTYLTFTPKSDRDNPPSSSAAVALLSDKSADAAFAQGEWALGDELIAGPVMLTRGTAQVAFKSGAVVDLAGPCMFDALSPEIGSLRRGQLEAFVPQPAHGFTIHVPGGSRIVDLGTRFFAEVDKHDRTFVCVTQGRVRGVDAAAAQSELTAGQGLRFVDGKLVHDASTDRYASFWLVRHRLRADAAMVRWLDFNDADDPAAGRFEYDGAKRFDGARDSITLDLPEPMRQCTVLALVKLDAVGSADHPIRAIMDADRFGPDAGFHWQISTANYIDAQGARTDDHIVNAMIGRWVWLAVVDDHMTGSRRIYADGIRIGVGACPKDRTTVLGTVRVGDWSGGARPLMGAMDEFAVLSRVLSEDEIKDLATAGRVSEEP